jgi:hypothetical protein
LDGASTKAKTEYPAKLRRIRYLDPETGQSLTFLTKEFELFFKWIKNGSHGRPDKRSEAAIPCAQSNGVGGRQI